VNVVLKSPVTKLNLPEVESMVSLAATRGLNLKLDGTITPKDDGDLSPLDYMVEPGQVETMMKRLEASGQLPGRVERERDGVNCGLGRITLAVDPEGNVYPCLQWRRSALGNVRERRLTEMWHGSPVRLESAEAGDLANRKLFEVGGPVSAFPFCPALADQMAGDPTAITARHEVHAKVASLLRRDESQA
jgi:MoaA/NifB/PqqE/SkfB family radical SAM enzyme